MRVGGLVAEVSDRLVVGVAEVGTVAIVVPDGGAAVVVKAARFGVGFAGVDAADLAGLDEVVGEGIGVVGEVAEGPVEELNSLGVLVLDFDVFAARFLDVYDLEVGGLGGLCRAGWGGRGGGGEGGLSDEGEVGEEEGDFGEDLIGVAIGEDEEGAALVGAPDVCACLGEAGEGFGGGVAVGVVANGN